MNVLVLVVDSLRRDFCYGDETNTPTVDALLEGGTRFDQAISSASWTPPCIGSLFSGIYPHRLDMYDFSTPFPQGVGSLFDHFADGGYEVGSFVFDENYLFKNVPAANVVDNFRDYSKPIQWIRDHSDEDFFLFVHHYWVHGPYEPQDSADAWSRENTKIHRGLRENHEEAVELYREKYANAVEEMSESWLRPLLGTLEEEGISEDTVVVFLGDHGESWGDRYDDPSVIQSNFHMHGKLLYDELVRIPLVFRYPGVVPEERTITEQVRQVDVFPTLMDLAGLKADDDWDRDGRSLVPAFEGDINQRRAISSATNVEIERIDKMAIRYPDEKCIWTLSTDDVELYDLQADVGETENLAEEQPDRAQSLKEELESELERSPGSGTLDSDVREQLEDLGYL